MNKTEQFNLRITPAEKEKIRSMPSAEKKQLLEMVRDIMGCFPKKTEHFYAGEFELMDGAIVLFQHFDLDNDKGFGSEAVKGLQEGDIVVWRSNPATRLPDGEYRLKNGKIMEVKNGLVKKISTASMQPQKPQPKTGLTMQQVNLKSSTTPKPLQKKESWFNGWTKNGQAFQYTKLTPGGKVRFADGGQLTFSKAEVLKLPDDRTVVVKSDGTIDRINAATPWEQRVAEKKASKTAFIKAASNR